MDDDEGEDNQQLVVRGKHYRRAAVQKKCARLCCCHGCKLPGENDGMSMRLAVRCRACDTKKNEHTTTHVFLHRGCELLERTQQHGWLR